MPTINRENQHQTIQTNPFYRGQIDLVRIPFKLAGTSQTRIYDIPTNLSIANFIEHIKNNAYIDFNINRSHNIEIVEAGQDIPNVRGEDAPALRSEFNVTVREKYDGRYDDLAFYIRVINYNYQHDRNQNNNNVNTINSINRSF